MGNSDVRLKHKVQLRRKVDDSKLADKSSIENSTTRPSSGAPKSRKMIWLIIGVIVLCFLGYFIFSLKSASNLNGNLNCSKELEHYAS